MASHTSPTDRTVAVGEAGAGPSTAMRLWREHRERVRTNKKSWDYGECKVVRRVAVGGERGERGR